MALSPVTASVARLTLAALLALPATPAAAVVVAPAAAPEPRLLFIALDCVPWGVVARLADPARGEQAIFRGMRGPAALISSFPSTTSVAMVGILEPLGLERSPGYEARFFDWEEGRVRGGGIISYGHIAFPWREFFDWTKRGPVASALDALHPARASIEGLERAVDAFLASPRQTYHVYMGATDLAAHLGGPKSLEPVLVELDRILARAHQKYPDRPFYTVLYSDHGVAGGEPLQNIWRSVRDSLAAGGWRFTQRLRGARDVALTPFGLVSSFELYLRPGQELAVARRVARVPGVDLCALSEDGGWRVVNARGEARVARRAAGTRTLWSYEPLDGDPLRYVPILGRLRQLAGTRAASPGFTDEQWFQASAGAHFPDALYRLSKTFELVENPASVVCSAAPGYMFGALKTEYSARLSMGALRWTHGALEEVASKGFLMSDVPSWRSPREVRFDVSLAPFADRVREEPGRPGTVAAAARSRNR